ncbi:HAD hydrolase, family IIA [Necator americanus]|uniref:HAD hydrolase, family IIA n=1 Tax=Necator americanus TaxID=51031 RepID=W2TEH6_NECAM|nr:HAD hydrolase, family IIA [Necator americanus]ETN80455.1 HAD hydrolase, family IIA [Necator americanus]
MTPARISREDLLKYDTFLFDVGGVLYKGHIPIPGAVEFVTTLLNSMKRVFIISNNSTKTPEQYLAEIEHMGFRGISGEQLITPAIVLAAYFKDRPEYAGQPIYLVGMEDLKNTLDTMGGVRCFGSGPDHFSSDSYEDFVFSFDVPVIPKAVVCSYDCHLSYPKIMKAATFLKRPEVEFLVTNEDKTLPLRSDVVVPGAGAVSSMVRAVSGRTPIVFGKPHKPIADFLKKHHHIDAGKTVMFGDRLDTDMQFANDNGFASCFMLTGVNTMDDVTKAEVRGEKHLLPTYTFSFSD